MTKLNLSKDESALINNSDWILSKHQIIKKIYDFFGDLLSQYLVKTKNYYPIFPENIKHQNGKISRGENYRLLPYIILDYPAFFWKENILAIRTFFWWGNFFSISLHLSGKHKTLFTSDPHRQFPLLAENHFYICTNDTEWEHHFGEDNYKPVAGMDFTGYEKLLDKDFFKIAKSIKLTGTANAGEFLLAGFTELLDFLLLSYPTDETNPSPVFPKAGSDL